jgi:hypothetical protein
MSALLLLGGIQQAVAGVLRSRKLHRANGGKLGVEVREPGADWLRWSATAAGIVGFALLLPWTGFVLAAGLFVVGYLRASGMAWWKGLLSAAGLAAAVVLLFGMLFRVQLPAGRLGLPF